MYIVRSGEKIKLTSEELIEAYAEQRNLYDIESVEINISLYLDEKSYEALKDNQDFIKEVAEKYRENRDRYNMNHDTALDEAFCCVKTKYINSDLMDSRIEIVRKALRVNREDARTIVDYLVEKHCGHWIDNFTEGNPDEPLTDVHWENDFKGMIDWKYNNARPSEMFQVSQRIEDHNGMLQLSDSVIFWIYL